MSAAPMKHKIEFSQQSHEELFRTMRGSIEAAFQELLGSI